MRNYFYNLQEAVEAVVGGKQVVEDSLLESLPMISRLKVGTISNKFK